MLKALNPLSKLGVTMLWLLASMLILDARFLGATIAIFAMTLLLINRTSPVTLFLLTLPLALMGMGFLTTNLLFHREDDYALALAGEAAYRSEALSIGLTLMLRSIAGGMVSIFFALTTEPGALIRASMAYLRLPARLGYALFAAMNLVPALAREAQQMRMARAMQRGRILRHMPGPREALSLAIPLLAFAIRRAGRTALSMEARGFDGEARRTLIRVPGFSAQDAAFVLIACAGLGILLSLL